MISILKNSFYVNFLAGSLLITLSEIEDVNRIDDTISEKDIKLKNRLEMFSSGNYVEEI
jgi:hypothetical protein